MNMTTTPRKMQTAPVGPQAVQAACNELLSGNMRPDAGACRRILVDGEPIESVIGVLSTSESIVLALAFGRTDLLPREYRDFRAAWRRLDRRQRHIVDIIARSAWRAKGETFTS